ncbi:hypothetical protein C8Q73DRAFT_694423 [Cubamyces lactineus]|nr:hypothetical protein C8Q73DRAFT_694423 [Cubamyces lactineus]
MIVESVRFMNSKCSNVLLDCLNEPATLHHHEKRGSTPDGLSSPPAPLTYNQQTTYDYRRSPRYRSGDLEPLSFVVREPQVQQSLESLISIESAPFTDFVTSEWPRLHA